MRETSPVLPKAAPSRLVVLQILASPRGWGGAEGVALLLGNHLRERGHEVLFAAPESDSLRRFRSADFAAYPVPVRSRLPLAAIRALVRFMRQHRVSVVHCHSRRAGIAGLPAARVAGVPAKILHAHSLATAAGSRRVSKLAFRILGLLADRTIYCSVAARDAVEGRHTECSVVIPNGVSLRSQPRTRPTERPTIVAVGRLAEAKGYRFLLEAVPQVASEFPTVRFEIAGDGELREDLLALSTRLGIGDNVAFLGFVEDVPSLLARATAFVMPSVWEGLPLALLEALAAGVPVVATAVGEVPRVLSNGQYGRLVPARSAASLAEALLKVLRDPSGAERRAARARDWVREAYSTDSMADAIERVYLDVLGDRVRGVRASRP